MAQAVPEGVAEGYAINPSVSYADSSPEGEPFVR